MKRVSLLLALTFAVMTSAYGQAAGGGAPSPADRHAAREAMLKACDADIKSYCSDKQGRELMMCLRGNSDKVSGGCKDAMASMRRAAPPPSQ
jgi:hypothetical protein